MSVIMQKLKARGHRYLLADLDAPTRDKIYYQTYNSYTKGETGQSWTKDQFFAKVLNGPWIFYGDQAFSGYITIRELREIKGLAKLTGCAGSKRGMLAGLTKLEEDHVAVFGAVTPEIYNVAIKAGFKTVDAMTLRIFVRVAPQEVWRHGGKPEISENGYLIINMPELGKRVLKRFICNEPFLQWTKQQKERFKGAVLSSMLFKIA